VLFEGRLLRVDNSEVVLAAAEEAAVDNAYETLLDIVRVLGVPGVPGRSGTSEVSEALPCCESPSRGDCTAETWSEYVDGRLLTCRGDGEPSLDLLFLPIVSSARSCFRSGLITKLAA
jgi:hypothetical protein